MSDPWSSWSAEKIAAASGCPVANVREHWPRVLAQLELALIGDQPVQIAAIGTIAIETASQFAPVREAFWLDDEWRRAHLPYYPWYGRGEIQLTHEANYRTYSQAVNDLWQAGGAIDLIARPDDALDPDVSAAVLACYFKATDVPTAARAGDWLAVRRKVYGGVDQAGAERITRIAAALSGAMPTVLPYDPDAKCDVQPDDWSCSIQSTQFLLRSIGRNPGDQWMNDQLVPEIVSPAVGLKDATGKPLADWITREYGSEMGFVAQASPVTFDDVKAGAGVNPTIVGGRHYGPGGHWVGIRRVAPDGSLELANPAPNYTNTGPTLDRTEWDARGPWSAIWIDRASTLPPPAQDTRIERALPLMRQAIKILEEPDPT